MWLRSSVGRVPVRCARGPGLDESFQIILSPGRAMLSPPVTFVVSILGQQAAKGPSRQSGMFRADFGTKLIKQGEIVTG